MMYCVSLSVSASSPSSTFSFHISVPLLLCPSLDSSLFFLLPLVPEPHTSCLSPSLSFASFSFNLFLRIYICTFSFLHIPQRFLLFLLPPLVPQSYASLSASYSSSPLFSCLLTASSCPPRHQQCVAAVPHSPSLRCNKFRRLTVTLRPTVVLHANPRVSALSIATHSTHPPCLPFLVPATCS